MSFPILQSISERLETTSVLSTVIPKPSGTVDGDLLLMFCNKGNASGSDTLPAGWTLVSTQATTSIRSHCLWKIASSEPADYTVSSSSGSARWVSHILRISGADATTPIHDRTFRAYAQNQSIIAAAPTPATRADVLSITAFFFGNESTPPHGVRTSIDYTELWNVRTDSSASGRGGLGVAFYPLRPGDAPGSAAVIETLIHASFFHVLINPADGRVTDNIEGQVSLGGYPVEGAEVSVTARLAAPLGPLSVVGGPVHIATVESDEYGDYSQEIDVVDGLAYDAYCRHSDSLGAYNAPSQWSE